MHDGVADDALRLAYLLAQQIGVLRAVLYEPIQRVYLVDDSQPLRLTDFVFRHPLPQEVWPAKIIGSRRAPLRTAASGEPQQAQCHKGDSKCYFCIHCHVFVCK